MQTTNGQTEEESRVALQGVLMGSLDTVEDISRVWIIAVHLRVIDLVLLASFANFHGEVGDHYHAGNTSENHIPIFFRQHNHSGTDLLVV